MSFLGRLVKVALREAAVDFVSSAASEIGEAVGRRIGALIRPEDYTDPKDDKDSDDESEESDDVDPPNQ